MLEGVSLPSLICMVRGGFLADSCIFLADSKMCVALLANTTVECKKRRHESLEIIQNRARKGPRIIKMRPRGVSVVSWEHSVSGTQRGNRDKRKMEPFWRQMVDLGCHIGAHWISKSQSAGYFSRFSSQKNDLYF